MLATKAGIDALIVSNHGGWFGDNGRAAIDAPRRSSKQSATGCRCGSTAVPPRHRCRQGAGARAIWIGRRYLWGLPPSARAR